MRLLVILLWRAGGSTVVAPGSANLRSSEHLRLHPWECRGLCINMSDRRAFSAAKGMPAIAWEWALSIVSIGRMSLDDDTL